ncbi:catalase-like domain-containing protein [Choanephora cucurbitarum]|nr:catalase-like domain-containing protein [Choanephora cucurbitarum]
MKINVLTSCVSLFMAAQLVAGDGSCALTGSDEKNPLNAKQEQLNKFTINDAGTQETTTFGLKVNNSDSLKAGLEGPTLLEDFMLREKITHFDHERIPERVVHARGVGVHGYFESYDDYSDITAASFLSKKGKQTPVFVRFSTVLGSRGSSDTVRDVRGFAVRFYTDEGNFDLVGNDIPSFFVNDGIKFLDLVHAAKPQPDTEVPQAQTAHETAYDFFAEFPESIHTVLWVLSGRGIPRSLRQIEGFGVNTMRFINEKGEAHFVKFMWKPKQGLANLAWDEAQKIAGNDPDFHRNDLYKAIQNGDYPEWEWGVQLVKESEAEKFNFSILDATKIIPESLVPFKPMGRLVLNRNPDNYFAETEQVTFHLGHIVRGIGFSNDPLLHSRLFSYVDTQINRMSSVNYMQLPINRPIVPVHNNQRDGFMQSQIHKGKVAYSPNRLQQDTPSLVPPEEGGWIDYPEKMKDATKLRGRPASFFDYYTQATLYYNSLTEPEKQNLVDAARFEIGKSKDQGVRERMVNVLNNVDNNLARRVALGLGITLPEKIKDNHNQTSIGLSIEKYPKPDNIKTRTVAILTAPGTNTKEAKAMYNFLQSKGAYPEYIGIHLGSQYGLDVTNTYLTANSVLYDAVYVPGGNVSITTMTSKTSFFPVDEPKVFIMDAFRHAKPIAASSEGIKLLEYAGIELPEGTSGLREKDGVILGDNESSLQRSFEKALKQQRFWSRLPIDPHAVYNPLSAVEQVASAGQDMLSHSLKKVSTIQQAASYLVKNRFQNAFGVIQEAVQAIRE